MTHLLAQHPHLSCIHSIPIRTAQHILSPQRLSGTHCMLPTYINVMCMHQYESRVKANTETKKFPYALTHSIRMHVTFCAVIRRLASRSAQCIGRRRLSWIGHGQTNRTPVWYDMDVRLFRLCTSTSGLPSFAQLQWLARVEHSVYYIVLTKTQS